MPDPRAVVINTGPLLALIAALGDLRLLQAMYRRVLVPLEVCEEIGAGGASNFGVAEFGEATWLARNSAPVEISAFLKHTLDRGEAAVIQLALFEGVDTVCIDEAVGRRIARLNGLAVTGSIGILLRAKREGHPLSIRTAVERMRSRGIRLGAQVVSFALNEAGESQDV